MLRGRNLIIAINGSTIAAAKSCSVDVQADTIKVKFIEVTQTETVEDSPS